MPLQKTRVFRCMFYINPLPNHKAKLTMDLFSKPHMKLTMFRSKELHPLTQP